VNRRFGNIPEAILEQLAFQGTNPVKPKFGPTENHVDGRVVLDDEESTPRLPVILLSIVK
jgi:hypothetical protein